jgi:hypothetical protein
VGLFPVETLAEIPVPEYASVHGYGFADSVERARNAASQDPNLAIRNSLGPSEVGAYFAALVGADPSDPNSEPGCSQASADPGYFSYLDSRRELIDEWKAQLFSDTRYLELEGTWSACMGDAGFSIPTRIQGVIEYFEPEMQALSPQPAESEIRDLRALEIEVALQDLECLQAIESKLRVLAAEHEAELLDQSGDLRSQLRELQRRYGP